MNINIVSIAFILVIAIILLLFSYLFFWEPNQDRRKLIPVTPVLFIWLIVSLSLVSCIKFPGTPQGISLTALPVTRSIYTPQSTHTNTPDLEATRAVELISTAIAATLTPLSSPTPALMIATPDIASTQTAEANAPTVNTGTPLIATATPIPVLIPTIIPTLSIAELIQEEIKKLSQGSLLFNPPNEMTVGQPGRVEVRIQKALSTTVGITGTPALATGLSGKGVPTVEPIKVGTFMEAKLSGEDFKISPLTTEEQMVGDDGFTQWAWDITPLQSGALKLNLVVSVRIKVPGGIEEKKAYAVKDKTVTVRVNPMYTGREFLANYWQWLTTALIIPFGIWLYKKLSPPESIPLELVPPRSRRRPNNRRRSN